MNSPKISVISPVYGAATLLEELVNRIQASVLPITDNYEIILVEDCSPDDSWDIIKSLSTKDRRIKGIRLSRNFGQQNALNAGLDYASGDWVVTLDCDLQDDPIYIRQLYQKGTEGYDIIFACRRNRKDSWIKKSCSKLFYDFFGFLTETNQDYRIANYVLYRRIVVDAMKQLGDYYRYYPMVNKWVGFNVFKLEIEHSQRIDNKKSSYSINKRLMLAYTTIIAFSDKPLRMVFQFGLAVVLLSVIVAVFLVLRYVIMGARVSGWLSVFLSIWFLSGMIIAILGLVSAYLGKMFETVKHRPTYIVMNKTNLK
ncbi:MAG: glycosyltransferase family 2 protein [Candidatus Omnitrophota bacterium]|nr:glycosyltransferase family 2 protein [Candidatus Omnitrophota bacterium]